MKKFICFPRYLPRHDEAAGALSALRRLVSIVLTFLYNSCPSWARTRTLLIQRHWRTPRLCPHLSAVRRYPRNSRARRSAGNRPKSDRSSHDNSHDNDPDGSDYRLIRAAA